MGTSIQGPLRNERLPCFLPTDFVTPFRATTPSWSPKKSLLSQEQQGEGSPASPLKNNKEREALPSTLLRPAPVLPPILRSRQRPFSRPGRQRKDRQVATGEEPHGAPGCVLGAWEEHLVVLPDVLLPDGRGVQESVHGWLAWAREGHAAEHVDAAGEGGRDWEGERRGGADRWWRRGREGEGGLIDVEKERIYRKKTGTPRWM